MPKIKKKLRRKAKKMMRSITAVAGVYSLLKDLWGFGEFIYELIQNFI